MRKKHATIVADLGFGDAGKGSIVDYLARRGGVSAIIRYNGGAQAAHNVVTPDGRHHTFHQFGSGTFISGIRTYLSRFMLVDPLLLYQEARELEILGCRNPLKRLSIDRNALVVTPLHKSANRLRELLRDANAHGTCGMGIGETMAHSLAFPEEAIRISDLCDKPILLRKTFRILERFLEEFRGYHDFVPKVASDVSLFANSDSVREWVDGTIDFISHLDLGDEKHFAQLSREGNLIFEGAQGVLLDEWYGFHPHTTWSTTTFQNALALLGEIGYEGEVERLGVFRAYFTRHGAGPFITGENELTRALPELHNGEDGWQGAFRMGWFDLVMARYALAVTGGADSLVVTNLDRLLELPHWRMCTSYHFGSAQVARTERDLLDDVFLSSNKLHARSLKKKKDREDLRYQERLTALLTKAIPEYCEVSTDVGRYLQLIEDELRVPVTLSSFGVSANEKRSRVRSPSSIL